MGQTTSTKQPWLAAILGLFVTGLGHLYLKRWRRAIGWLFAMFFVSYVFIDPAMMESVEAGEPIARMAFVPILIVGSLSALDAYVLARVQNTILQKPNQGTGASIACPNCGKELDEKLDFCQWCGTQIAEDMDRNSVRADDP